MRLHKLYSATVVTALVASAILVVVLALQKRSLLDRQQEFMTRMRDPHPGLYVPTVNMETMTGDSARLGEPGYGRAQLFFVFATTCDFSEASLPAWQRIASQFAESSDVDVYGISVDGVEETQAFVAEHDIRFSVVSFTDRRLRALYRTYVVPQTVVIDGDGKVTYANVGAVTEAVASDSIIASTNSTTEESIWGVVAPALDSLP